MNTSTTAATVPDFANLAFAGGGIRCFWQGGFLDVVAPTIELEPDTITAVSGGALSACAFVAGAADRLRETFREVMGRRESNVSSWDEVGENGLTPHQEMYREVVERVLGGDAVGAIAEGPALHVQLARPPSAWLPALTTAPVLTAYKLDMLVRSTPVLIGPRLMGARALHVDARQAAREGKLTDLVCSAAVIPPVFNVRRWDGGYVMDGGMIGNVMPPPKSDRDGATLAVLTRRFRAMPGEGTVWESTVWAEPSRDVPADRIDFTDPGKIDAAWALGRRDGEAFLATRGWDQAKN